MHCERNIIVYPVDTNLVDIVVVVVVGVVVVVVVGVVVVVVGVVFHVDIWFEGLFLLTIFIYFYFYFNFLALEIKIYVIPINKLLTTPRLCNNL